MNFLKSIIFGFLSGVAQFLPISSAAHQQLIASVLDIDFTDPIRKLFIHVSILIALFIETAQIRAHLSKAQNASKRNRTRNSGLTKTEADHQFLRNMKLPFLIVFFFISYILPKGINLLLVSVFLLINGILLFLPERMLQGNKNAKVMTKLDGVMIGAIGGLSAFPGLSCIGSLLFAASFRGADRKSAVNWALILSITALYAWIFRDILELFSGISFSFWSNFFWNITSALCAFTGSRFSIYILKRHIRKIGCTSYAYYCWGAALFALMLFLTIA